MTRATILASLAVALASTQALADGTVVKDCGYFGTSPCLFDAVKGADYLISVNPWGCSGSFELVNPVG